MGRLKKSEKKVGCLHSAEEYPYECTNPAVDPSFCTPFSFRRSFWRSSRRSGRASPPRFPTRHPGIRPYVPSRAFRTRSPGCSPTSRIPPRRSPDTASTLPTITGASIPARFSEEFRKPFRYFRNRRQEISRPTALPGIPWNSRSSTLRESRCRTSRFRPETPRS